MKGFYYFPNFLSLKQSQQIQTFLDSQDWKKVVPQSYTSREVIQYGYEYNYNSRGNSKTSIQNQLDPIPEILRLNFKNVEEELPHLYPRNELNQLKEENKITQCIINKYEPGQGIGMHTDSKAFGPVIFCVTLGSGCEITFSNPNSGEEIKKYVDVNSLYIMSDECRYLWKHKIDKRKFDDRILSQNSNLKENENRKARKNQVVQRIKRGTRISLTYRSYQPL